MSRAYYLLDSCARKPIVLHFCRYHTQQPTPFHIKTKVKLNGNKR